MNEDQFRAALNRANRENQLLFVTDGTERGIALGLDSKRGVAILHGGKELPLADIVEDIFS